MKLSGSKISLAKHCTWWAREDVALPSSVASAHANAGTDKHTCLEKILLCGPMLSEEFRKLWGCDPRDVNVIQTNILDWLPFLTAECEESLTEIPLAYDPKTDKARELPRGQHREYIGLRPGEIPLTLDLVAFFADGTGLVIDHKTGRQDNLDRACESGQLGIGALAFARLHKLDTVRVAYTIVGDDGCARIDEATLDAFDLESIAEEIKGLAETIARKPDPSAGPWCKSKYCPALGTCPVTLEAIQKTESLAPLSSTSQAPISVSIQSAEHCAKVHTQLALAEEFLGMVRAAIEIYVKEHGAVPLADGSLLDLVAHSRESLDIDGNERALDALQKALGPAYDRAVSVKVSTNKEAIKAATGQLAKGRDRTSLERAILEDLAELGAIKVSTYEKIDVIKPSKQKAA